MKSLLHLQGNLRSPPIEKYLQWVVDAWNHLHTDLIKSSFKARGISNAIDGSEDSLIHVFKPNGSCPEGMDRLSMANDTTDVEAKLNHEKEIKISENDENYNSECSIEII